MRASATAPDFARLPLPQAPALARFHFDPALAVQSQVTEKPPFAKLAEPARTAPTEVSFGPFRLLPMQFLVLEGDKPVPLGSRALEILIALVERAGELVSKQELTRSWPKGTAGSIARCPPTHSAISSDRSLIGLQNFQPGAWP